MLRRPNQIALSNSVLCCTLVFVPLDKAVGDCSAVKLPVYKHTLLPIWDNDNQETVKPCYTRTTQSLLNTVRGCFDSKHRIRVTPRGCLNSQDFKVYSHSTNVYLWESRFAFSCKNFWSRQFFYNFWERIAFTRN